MPPSFLKTFLLSAILLGVVGSFVFVPLSVQAFFDPTGASFAIAGAQQAAAKAQALGAASSACNDIAGGKFGKNIGGTLLSNAGSIAGLATGLGAISSFKSLLGGLGGGGQNAAEQMTLDQICRAVKEQVLLQKRQEQATAKAKLSKTIAAVAYKNAITIFFTRLAYNTAVKLTSGGPGQKPLFVTNWTGRNGVFNTAFDEATGEFFNSLLKDVWKSSLCEPITPLAKVRIELLARSFATPQSRPPSCSFSKFYKNIVGQDIKKAGGLAGVGDQLSNAVSQLTLKDIGIIQDYFNPSSNDLGALLTIMSGLSAHQEEKVGIAKLRREIEGEFKSKVTTITDVVQTPATVIRDYVQEGYVKGGIYPYLAYTGDAFADALGVFTNTLASRLMERALTKGFNSPVDNQQIGLLILGSQSPIQAAMRKFASIIEKPDLKTGQQSNILEQITYAGGGDQFVPGSSIPEQNFALIDTGLRSAIEQRMTVRKALALGYLDGTKAFGMIPGRPESANATVGGEGGNPSVYSLRSLTLLAKYRIIPSLWPAAAEFIVNHNGHSYCVNNRCTLTELVEKYNDAGSPFFHLIDQTWILTAPQVFVRRVGYGRLQSADVVEEGDQIIGLNNIDRMSGAVDEQTCIYTDPRDPEKCLYYGYCTEDRSIYRIQGDRCDAWNNTCQTVTQAGGGTFSYLLNSVHRDTCAEPGAQGCREYCTRYNDISNVWECVSPGVVYNQCGPTNAPPGPVGVSTGTGYDGVDRECGCSVLNAKGIAEVCQIPLGGISCVTAGGLLCRLGTGNVAPETTYAENPSTIFLNSRAATRTSCTSSGCSEFLRFRHPSTNAPYTRDETIAALVVAGKDPNATVDTYSNIDPLELPNLPNGKQPLVEKAYIRRTDAMCQEADLGCELYTPTNSDPSVPGIIDPLNGSCPKECNGLRRYQMFSSFFDPAPSVTQFDFSTLTVPSDKFCSASSDGCEEFTNQITGNTEYYSKFRSCVRPGTTGVSEHTYYTYEGQDTQGLGLKDWKLVAESASSTAPPCTNVLPNGTCVSGTAAICGEETPLDPTDDQEVNPDCRQFYAADPSSANVVTYWRLQSKTSFVSPECTNYRRSIDQSIWWAEPADSAQYRCSASVAGCRQFKGVNSANIRYVPLGSGKFVENFEGSSTFDPITNTIIGWTGGTLSSRAVYIGGRSVRVATTLESNFLTAPLNLKKGAVYEISFWAIAESASGGTINASLAEPSNAGSIASFTLGSSGSGALSGTNWQYFRGTLTGKGYLETIPPVNAVLSVSATGPFFIDNIALKETPDSVYLIKDSWVTPPICLAPTSQLGCQEYTDQFNTKLYIKNFSRLCLPEVVGCAPLIDTHNSDEVAKHSWNMANATSSDDITVPADSLVYMVNSPATRCSATEKGCTLLGRGSYEQHQSLSFSATSLVVDPAQFDRTLCTAEKEFCDAYTAEESVGAFFFKDPGARVCEWKTGIVDSVGRYIPGGWFVRGTNQICPAYQSTTTNASAVDGYCLGGASISANPTLRDANKCQSNTDCTKAFAPGQIGTCSFYPALCPADQNTCAEFQDPQHPVRGTKPCDPLLALGEPLGASVPNYCDYYYYQRNTMDTSGCSSQNPEDGCVGFNDTVNDQKTVATTKQCLKENSAIDRIGAKCDLRASPPNPNCGVACADQADCDQKNPGTSCGYL